MNAPGSPPFPEAIPRRPRFHWKTTRSGVHRRWLPWISASLLVLGSITVARPIRAAESEVAPPSRTANDASATPSSTAAEAPVVLPPWVVTESLAGPLQSARTDYFASTLGPTSVVTASDWSGRGVTTLAAALRGVPGVMLQDSFGGFEPPRLSIRGSGLDSAPTSRGVALLADGLPLARADGSFNSALFDPQLFPRVEIYRGTLHMALTPAVLGGVINAASFAPGATPGVVLQVEGGNDGTFRAQLTDHAAVSAAASFQESDGERAHSSQQRTAVQLAALRNLTPTAQLELTTYAATLDYDVPGPLTLADAYARPDFVSAAVLRDQPRRASWIVRPAAQLKAVTTDGEAAVGLAGQWLHDDFYQLQPNGESELDARSLTGHATLSRRVSIGGAEHQFLVRAIFTTGADDIDRYLNVLSQRGAEFGAYTARANTVALNLEDIVWVTPTVAIGAGATALHGTRDISARAPSPSLSSSLDFDDVSPRGAVLWSPNSQFSLHAAVSRGIEPPTFDDLVAVQGTYPHLALALHPLQPQSAVTLETGAQGSAGALDWSLTVYRAEWRNEILRLADASGLPRGAVNAARTLHEGIEASLHWRMLTGPHRLGLTVASTLGRFTFEDDPIYGDNRLAGAPPQTGSAELLYESPHGFYAALGSTWAVGPIPVDHAGRLTYGGYALGDARVGWQVHPRVRVFASVHNLFDRAYIASTAGVLDVARDPPNTSIFLPGTGRSFLLGLEWKP